MSKRPSSPTLQAATRPAKQTGSPSAPAQRQRTAIDATHIHHDAGSDDGMGEFEDQFEDEFEQDDPSTVHVAQDVDSDDDEDEGETMDFDGVKVDAKITRPEDEQDDDSKQPDQIQAYIPGVNKLEEGQTLQVDQSAYEMLHKLNVTWPCLSFDFLKDNLGNDRQSFPHTAYFVAGTQADVAKNNEVIVLKASSLHKTQNDDNLSDDEDDDDDGLDDDAILEHRSIPVVGGINRVRAAPVANSVSDSEPCLDPYPVAVWNEIGKVQIFDVRPLFHALDRPGFAYDKRKVNTPMHTVEAHRGVEGYAMDWAGVSGNTSSNLRLLSGDIHSKIFLTTCNNTGFVTHPTPFLSHTSSVEDLQWSPSEPTVFASCSADRSIRIWDVRVKSRKNVICVEHVHLQDVNVISWNKRTDYLLLSGGDEGHLNVWDLRSLKSASSSATPVLKPTPVASFQWHTAPISSVEWHPTEDSIFMASGKDDQVTLWDLSVERDQDDEPNDPNSEMLGPDGNPVPSQLLFSHQGTIDPKEVHWHHQIPGMIVCTALDGFNLFKTISV